MPRDVRIDRRTLLVLGAVVTLAVAGREISRRYRAPLPDDGYRGPLIEQTPCQPLDWSAAPPYKIERAAVLAVTGLTGPELSRRKIERRTVGELHVDGGCIVGTDPLVFTDGAPFRGTVPPGRYPVTSYRQSDRIALLELRFAQGPVERWQMALVGTADPSTLKNGETLGYPVDAGLGSFMDVAGQAALRTRMRHDEGKADGVLDAFLEAFRADRQIMFQPLRIHEANVAVVASGWGDGVYATYWGLDAASRPILLVTDFDVIDGDRGPDSQARP